MPTLADLKIQIYADGADYAEMIGLAHHPLIKGFTTNPSLLLKAGVTDYERFAKDLIARIPDKPISFEVLADDVKEMGRQARKLAAFGPNVYVKIPVMQTNGDHTYDLIEALAYDGIQVNVTAVMTRQQVAALGDALTDDTPAIVSIFAGRIADTGVNVGAHVRDLIDKLRWEGARAAHVLWASPRELLNIFQAEEAGADIITLPMRLIQQFDLIGKDLTEYSRETVAQFYADGQKAKLSL